jgi:hypothetical protein
MKAALATTATADQPGTSPPRAPEKPNQAALLGVLAVLIVATILIASLGYGLLVPYLGTARSTAVFTATQVESGGSLVEGSLTPLCSGITPSEALSNSKIANGSAAIRSSGPSPTYDEQFILGFEQNFSSSLSYNVTLRAQNDSYGYGPAYLLNGLTDSGYWYQVGVAWDLGDSSPSSEGGGGAQQNQVFDYASGFRFVYEVWNTDTQRSVFPLSGGTLPTTFMANDGDVVLLRLNMTGDGQVSMTAFDWNTSASGFAQYNAHGASQFLGYRDKVTPYPTSLLTEWYHVLPYFCSDRPVVYSNDATPLSAAWMSIDEWNLTGTSTSQYFNSSVAGECCVFSTGNQAVSFQPPSVFRSLSENGTTIYADSTEFVTP